MGSSPRGKKYVPLEGSNKCHTEWIAYGADLGGKGRPVRDYDLWGQSPVGGRENLGYLLLALANVKATVLPVPAIQLDENYSAMLGLWEVGM